MLDVNLGHETSIAVALALQAKGVRFIFHTGADVESIALLEVFNVPVIPKLQARTTLLSNLAAEFGRQLTS